MKANKKNDDAAQPKPREVVLRDFLADHLDLIEPGMRLVRKEYPLKNPIGAGGFVDILARDRFGLHVVIEIKRSNATSREAIQELHKYVELIQKNFGLTHAQVRCVLLSTDWHELLVPFSAFARTAPFHVEGRRVVLGDGGNVLRLDRVEKAAAPVALRVFRQHTVFLFFSEDQQRAFPERLVTALAACGVESAVVAAMHAVDPSRLMYPFCQYLMVGGVAETTRGRLEDELRVEYDIPASESVEEDTVEGQLACEVMNKCDGWDSMEIGYPEKFVAMKEKWAVTNLYRFGRYTEAQLFTDEDLLTALAGLRDTSQTMFSSEAHTAHTAAWNAAKTGALKCLSGNDEWSRITAGYFAEVDAANRPTVAGIRVYDPADLVMTLFQLCGRGDPRFVPSMHLALGDDGDDQSLMVGMLVWDGTTTPENPAQLLGEVFGGDPLDYFSARTMGGLVDFDAALMRRHGLRYATAEWVADGGRRVRGHWVEWEQGKLVRRDMRNRGVKSLKTFLRRNMNYCRELVGLIESISQGL